MSNQPTQNTPQNQAPDPNQLIASVQPVLENEQPEARVSPRPPAQSAAIVPRNPEQRPLVADQMRALPAVTPGNSERLLTQGNPSGWLLLPHIVCTGLCGVLALYLAIFVALEAAGIAFLIKLMLALTLGWKELDRRATHYQVTNKRILVKKGFLSEEHGFAQMWAVHSVSMNRSLGLWCLNQIVRLLKQKNPQLGCLFIHLRDGKVLPLEPTQRAKQLGELIEATAREARQDSAHRGEMLGGSPSAGLEAFLAPRKSEF